MLGYSLPTPPSTVHYSSTSGSASVQEPSAKKNRQDTTPDGSCLIADVAPSNIFEICSQKSADISEFDPFSSGKQGSTDSDEELLQAQIAAAEAEKKALEADAKLAQLRLKQKMSKSSNASDRSRESRRNRATTRKCDNVPTPSVDLLDMFNSVAAPVLPTKEDDGPSKVNFVNDLSVLSLIHISEPTRPY